MKLIFKIIVGSFVVSLIAASLILNYLYNRHMCGDLEDCPLPYKQTDTPTYQMGTSYGDGAGGYECSKPIQMVSYTLDNDGTPVLFSPVDKDEAKLFCHMTYAIEYEGKLEVLRKPEVLELISKYEYKDVNIKALEFEYIEDKDFVDRVLPTYSEREIGCIIILETPNEKLVYLEDENLETFEIIDYQVFEGYLNNLSQEDRDLFINNLQ